MLFKCSRTVGKGSVLVVALRVYCRWVVLRRTCPTHTIVYAWLLPKFPPLGISAGRDRIYMRHVMRSTFGLLVDYGWRADLADRAGWTTNL